MFASGWRFRFEAQRKQFEAQKREKFFGI